MYPIFSGKKFQEKGTTSGFSILLTISGFRGPFAVEERVGQGKEYLRRNEECTARLV
jgi:hypothetical protein